MPLNGCLVFYALDGQPAPRQTTCCSRTFGEAIRDNGQVNDAIMTFAERVAEKVHHAGQVAGTVQLFSTDPFEANLAQKSVSGASPP